MKNTIKKIIASLALLTLLLSLTACGNKSFKCDMCKKEKVGKSYKSQLMGEEITICDDCYKSMNDFVGN